ncbi:uncharacterized protein LOC121254388 isoform X1 [Juglans microcarpa x Juglans regia]|uniref:uncharacterized protein LOC121254388 isoform X1 n=1 Tax=Juglans microcarpa x Juglans regia TaxID=2249226 RepID=UPI001B7F4A9E|nr:uncharacterized protein LOC121254388 isoform X1 [Juglans microcarpa x Juglans regia]
MMSTISSHRYNWSLGFQEHFVKGRSGKVPFPGYSGRHPPSRRLEKLVFLHGQCLDRRYHEGIKKYRPVLASMADDGMDPDDSQDSNNEKESPKSETGGMNSEILRENLERIVGTDDSTFSGIDLANLIRDKYGRSYDVQLIKKEFMGRNLLALNVMWKYMEQRSFPLTEEEYLLRLDDVANTLKCWGAVSHIRNSLAKLKERPRIGKAVSIFIDMDESGGRANEWIYK